MEFTRASSLIGATYEQTSQRMAENKVGATFDYCMQMWQSSQEFPYLLFRQS